MKWTVPLLLVAALAAHGAIAQDMAGGPHLNVHIQPLEDTAAYRGILRSLGEFLAHASPRTQAEYDAYTKPNLDLYMDMFTEDRNVKPTLLEVVPSRVKDQYIVKLAFMRQDSGGFCSLRLLYNMLAMRDGSGFRFRKIMDYMTREYARTQVGTITYIYRDRERFDRARAEKMDRFNLSLARKLALDPRNIVYYKCKDPVELFTIRGYDFTPMMYVDTTGGRLEYDSLLLAANNSEYYPHELVHAYVGRLTDSVSSWIFNEGFATYIAGVERFTLDEMLKRIKEYVHAHPETDIVKNAMNDVVAGRVSFTYAIGGLVCRLAYEKEGLDGIRKLLRSGEGEKNFYRIVDQVLGIKQNDVSSFIRKQLEKD